MQPCHTIALNNSSKICILSYADKLRGKEKSSNIGPVTNYGTFEVLDKLLF